MSNLVRKATLLTVGGLLLAGVTNAGVPNNVKSIQPPGFTVVGYYNPPDSRGVFTYTIRDETGANVGAGIEIDIDFTNCTDFTICPAQTVGGTVEGNVLKAKTDGLGQVTIGVVGKGNNGGPARTQNLCATVTAGGQTFSPKLVATLDLSGTAGADGADLAVWVLDFLKFNGVPPPSEYHGRSDFNYNGLVDGGDLAIWVSAFVENNVFGTGTALSCP